MEAEIPIESNESPAGIKENGFLLRLVSRYASGEGLTYALIDWPNPGKTWSWKVGGRLSNSGYYCDRYMFLPKCLQRPGRRRECFASQPRLSGISEQNFLVLTWIHSRKSYSAKDTSASSN